MNNDELINKILDSLSIEELLNLAKYADVKIGGFREISNKIPRVLLVNGIKLMLLKKTLQPITSKDEYIRLYNKQRNDFYIHILSDLNAKRNDEIINDIVNSVFKSAEDNCKLDFIGNKNLERYDGLKNENDKLKRENEDLKSEIKRMKREFRKELDGNNKKYIEDLKKEREKLKNNMQLESKLESVKLDYDKVLEDNNRLRKILLEYEKQTNEIEYIKKFFCGKNILMVDLKPLNDKFPYKFKSITIKEVYKSILPKENITDVWIAKYKYNDFILTQIILLLGKEYKDLNITYLDNKDIEKLEVGVINE